MKKKPFPFYPFLFAAFPVIALFSYNRFEIQFSLIFRPLIIAILFGTLVYAIFFFIFKKNNAKAAFISGVSILLFFSYGHIYNLIASSPALSGPIGHHWFLVPVYVLIWAAALILTILRPIKSNFTRLLNYFSIILVVLPILQTGWFYVNETITHNRMKNNPIEAAVSDTGLNYQPDVYYIVLDTFARPDALEEDYGIDLSGFVDEMEAMGFYYASESQSNYGETFTSISSSLNMDLISDYTAEHGIDLGSAEYQDLLIHSKVRSLFENMGYQTIAFSTGYRWSEWSDADIYNQIVSTDPLGALTPFEILVYKSTFIYPFRGYYLKYFPLPTTPDYGYVGAIHSLHIETQLNVLNTLPEIPLNTNPTFTFAHVLIPHVPYVFAADGTLLQDPGYFSGERASAVNDSYELDGYKNQVEFISSRIAEIAQQILERSPNPPIIIIQGDHGWKGDNRHKILDLYYFPDENYGDLYPTITPINSFRVVFDRFYGMDLPLVEDKIVQQDDYKDSD